MKKLLLTIGITLLVGVTLLAQAPRAFKYQAIARDIEGNVLADQQVSLRINLVQGNETGQVIYSETHLLKTNQYGLINLEIGNGKNQVGEFTTISWGLSKYYVNIEMDLNGGTNFKSMGVSPLLSVPYALYAETSGNNSGGKGAEWTNGTGVTYLTNTNNYVGIGLNNPSAKLHIDAKTGNLNSGIKLFLSLENSNSKYRYTGIDFFSYTSGLTGQLLISGNTYNNPIVNLPTNSFGFFTQNTNGSLVFHATGSGGDIRMGTGGYGISNERLRIDVAGNVGIGLTSPSYKLDVAGDVNISAGSNYKIDGVDMVSSPWSTSGTDVYYSNGYVGIGSSAPMVPLDISRGSNSVLSSLRSRCYWTNTAGYMNVWGKDDYDGFTNLDIDEKEIGILGISDGSLVTPDDNIGIFGFSNGIAGYFENETSGNSASLATSTAAGYFDGKVGIATNTPSTLLDVQGIATSTSNLITSKVNYTGNFDIRAVDARSVTNPGYGVGVYGEGGYRGVQGHGNGASYTGTASGGYFTATGTAGTRIGVYGSATGTGTLNCGVYGSVSGATTNYAGYFTGGGVMINQETTNPDVNTVYGNSMPIAYGVISTTTLKDYGIASVTYPSIGEWTITLDNNFVGEPIVLITAYNNIGTNNENFTYSIPVGGNTIDVHCVDNTGNPRYTMFSIVVFGEPD